MEVVSNSGLEKSRAGDLPSFERGARPSSGPGKERQMVDITDDEDLRRIKQSRAFLIRDAIAGFTGRVARFRPAVRARLENTSNRFSTRIRGNCIPAPMAASSACDELPPANIMSGTTL